MDSTTSIITIIRTQNCLDFDFTYTADSFYTSSIKFKATFDSTKESGVFPIVTWLFGDNSTGSGISPQHVYDSAKYYDACMVVKNYYTGCVNSVCKPVLVQMNTTCNANFLIRTYSDPLGFILPARTILFNGALSSQKNGKRHSWIINDRDTTVTGNSENFKTNFFTASIDTHFDVINNSCGYGNIDEICIDSLNKKVTHIIYDSISGCSDSVSQSLIVPRQYAPFINAVPDPSLPYYVSFYAYTGSGPDSLPYSSVWRISNGGGGYYTGNYTGATNKLTYTFPYPGNYTVAVAAKSCSGGYNNEREVYYINYQVAPVVCPIYPPDFSITVPDSTYPETIRFWDNTLNQNANLNCSAIWYFGDGDSSYSPYQSFPTHTYSSPGSYNATLKLISPGGCSKQFTKSITVLGPCTITSGFSLSRDAVIASRIIFANTSASSTDSLSYIWYFGNGDSSIEKNPVYFYSAPGTYQVKLKTSANSFCIRYSDTIITVSANDICNLHAGFTDIIEQNIVYFRNASLPGASVNKVNWDFGDGEQDTSTSPIHKYAQTGTYIVCLNVFRDNVCSSDFCDSVIINSIGNRNIEVIPNPVNGSFVVQYISQFAEPIVIDIISSQGINVQSIHQQSVIGVNKYNLNASALQSGYYIIRISAASGTRATTPFLKI